MATGSLEKRYTPFIILLLVAALVATLGLWAADRSASGQVDILPTSGSTETL